ncbi:MAG TPA: fibronectin type III domain-containing protein [Trebonia sp.]|jgi:hypothetical protein
MQLRRLATPVVLGVAVVTVVSLAASAHGFPVQHVSLNDGAIWVTNNTSSDVSVGRFAKPIGQLDGYVSPQSATSVNVWQDGPLVATYGSAAAGGRLYAVDVDDTDLANPDGTAIPPVPADTSGIALGGDREGTTATLAVLGTDHSLRSATLTADSAQATSDLDLDSLAQTSPPLAKGLPGNSAVAVGADGTIWVAGGGELREFLASATTPAVTSLPPVMLATDSMQVTTVGNVPVVADATARWLYLPDGNKTVPLPPAVTPAGFVLQQSSASSDFVVGASPEALYSVNLSSGQLTTLSGGHSGTAAAPVQVGGCVQSAWADGESGSYVRDCALPSPAAAVAQSFSTGDADPQLVFRVNNGEVVLNDTADGGVFLVDSKVTDVTPQWQQNSGIKSPVVTKTQGTQLQDQFRANPLTQGVRPGVTTEVHVLDAVKGNPALTYAVTAVGQPDQPGVTVSVAPDSQTVLAKVTSLTGEAHFQYTVDDGQGHIATNEVTLVPRAPGENSAPALKQNYQPPSLSVAAGGTLVVPVIGDWRDADGDSLYIDGDSVSASAGSAAVTTGGALSFTAPGTKADETVTLAYGVSDGRVAKPTMATLKVSVLGSSSSTFVPPVAEPDAAQAVAGAPVTLGPLANDLPGVDPTNPQAKLRLAAPLSPVDGATISTDLADGTVTFIAQRAGDYFLSYTDAYGAAPTAKGTIRVHVIAASGKPQPPVTTPDVAVLHGQQPALVDVLADCSDPQGWLMGITDASSATPGVSVTVIDSEWLRISADDPQPGMTATVSYTVSDGKGSATGTVAVSAVAVDPNADQITTTNDSVIVRAGDSAAVPVLDGDTSSTGLPLALAGTPPTATPPVTGLLAGIQGNDLRVDAPALVTAEEETAVSYVATDADGTTETGQLEVTIMPAPSKADPDQAPAPEEVDTRVTAGDTAVIQIPTSGVDPDGDSVTVTGVTVPPALGRIVAVGPDSISYQSYAGSLGTDTFTYQVADTYGLTGIAQVRVAVLPAGPPQPPVAVDDVISAPPGVPLHWNVLSNDYIAPGDKVTVEPLAKTNTTVPPGVRLAGAYVYLPVPASPSVPPVEFSYGATDGSMPSLAQVIVHAVSGAQIPPIANDVIAPLPGAGAKTITVNVLKNDDDPVGTPNDLKVSWAGDGATVDGASLTVKLACYPYAVPYQVTAPDKLSATAVVYIQGTSATACPPSARQASTSTIALKPGAQITMKANGTVTVPLGSMLTDSAGRQLKLTTTAGLTASPAGDLAVSANQESAFTVHALGGYAGPGAVTVTVYDGQTIQDGTVATVTIPVQIGADVPVLHCPTAPLPVIEGGAALSYDIGQLCNVSVDAGATPRYTVAWTKAAAGVSESVPGGTTLRLSAASSAAPDATGTLKITPVGAGAGHPGTGGTLNVQVVKAPLPAGRPASASATDGKAVTIDLAQYVTSPLPLPDITVLGVTTQAGSTATATVTHSGSNVIVTPGADASGTLTLTASVSDEPGRTDRAINVAITVTVIGHPGAPGKPTVTESSKTLVVSFGAAAANGAPVEYYTVYTNGTANQCPASPCTITGLTNGTTYTVYVTATNSTGISPDSPQATATLDAVPGQVIGVTATSEPDGSVALTWQAPEGNPTGYEVEVSPPPAGQQITSVGNTTSHTFTGLTQDTSYTFTVMATNAAGDGPWSLGVDAVPRATPQTPNAPVATSAAASGTSGTAAITVTAGTAVWSGSGPPAIDTYTIYEYRASSSSGPWTGSPVASASYDPNYDGALGDKSPLDVTFTVNSDGSWYEYTITATNELGTSQQSPFSSPAIQAAAAATAPSAPTGVTATATGQSNTIQFSFTAGAANGGQLTSIEYGINSATKGGTITSSFTAGTSYTETLTNASDSAIVNGTPVTVYLAECTTATVCSSFAGPSNQVTPTGAPTAPATLTVSLGAETNMPNYIAYGAVPIHIAVTNMPADSVVNYTCTDPDTADFMQGTSGTSYDTDSSGATVTTDASGAASFDSYYIWTGSPTAEVHLAATTVTCTSGNASDSYTAPAVPARVTISEGAANPGGTANCANCFFVHIQTSGEVVTTPTLSCTTENVTDGLVLGPVTSAPATTATSETSSDNSAGSVVQFVGSGSGGPPIGGSWDSNIEWVGGFAAAGDTLSCTVTQSGGGPYVAPSVTGTYTTP